MNVNPGFPQGQRDMDHSLPVVIASDQSPVAITGSITATNPSVGLTSTTAPTSATEAGGVYNVAPVTLADGDLGALQLDVNSRQIIGAIASALPAGSNVIGHVIADSGSTTAVTGNVTVVQPTGTNLHTVIDSGTVAATQSGTWTVQPGNTANTTPWLTTINQGGNSAAVTGANALKVDGSAVTQPISAASLPLPTGAATEATLSALNDKFTSSSAANTSLSQSTSNQLALASNVARKSAVIYNNSDSAHIFVNYGAAADTTSAFVTRIDPRGTLSLNNDPVYNGDINIISDVANGTAQVTELS